MGQLLSKNQIKLIRSLKQKKYRYKLQKYVVEGEKMIRELWEFNPDFIEFIVIAGDADLELPGSTFTTDHRTFKSVSSLEQPRGILAVCTVPGTYWEPVLWEGQFSVYLDGIQDPGNLGTMIRTADWFGIRNIIVGSGTVDPFNPKSVQASMSSLFNVKLSMASPENLQASGVPLMAADMAGEDAYDFHWPDNGVLIMGNEGNGISDAVGSLDPVRITIPRHQNAFSESLNVSMAFTSLLTLRNIQLRM